jgi:hypothetical protein
VKKNGGRVSERESRGRSDILFIWERGENVVEVSVFCLVALLAPSV